MCDEPKRKPVAEAIGEALGRELSPELTRECKEFDLHFTSLLKKKPSVMDMNELQNKSYAGRFREGQRLFDLPLYQLGGVTTKWCYLSLNRDNQYPGISIEIGKTLRLPEVSSKKRTMQ